jgi:two-component system, cell cycle sensor histidine kinase and response regulator CckA
MNLRAKVLLPLAFSGALLVGYLYGDYMPRSRANIEANYQRATEHHLDSVIEGLIPLLLAHELDTIYENLDALLKKNGDWVGIELKDPDNRLLYPLAALPARPGPGGRDEVHVLTRRIAYLDTNLGTLTVKVDFAPLLSQTRQRHRELLTIMLSVIASYLLSAAYLLEHMVIRPVNALTLASRNLARGSFDASLGKAGDDEVGQLVDRFAEMRDAIRGYQTELLERSRVLMRNERNLAEAQRMAHLGSWEFDLRKNEIIWSDEIYRIFGLERREFCGTYQAFMEMVHPGDREYVNASYTRSVQEISDCDIMHRIVRKSDGAIRYVHQHAEHLLDELGAVCGSRGTVLDITEKKQAEEEIHQLASIVESSDDAIFSKSLDGVILTWNPAAERMYGYAAKEIKGRSVTLLFPPEHLDELPVILGKVSSGEHIYQHETVRRKKDGQLIHVSLTVSPLRDASSAIIGAATVGRDITEQKRISRELKFKNILLSTQQETSLDGILAVDEQGSIISYNRRFAEIWDVPSGILESGSYQFAWQSLTDKLKDPEDFLAKSRYLYLHKEEKSRDEIFLKDGRILDQYSSPMVDQSGRDFGRVWYFRDVTDRHKLEDQLRQSQKMESIGIFAGGIAHDFNNILTAIIGYGNISLMKMAPDDPLRQNIEHILEAAAKAAHLTKDILLFSRKQVSERKPVDLNEIIRTTQKFLKRVIGEDIECRTMLSSEPMSIVGDAHQLEQALMNFATNARDAMHARGVFTITTDRVLFDKEFITTHGYGTPGSYVLVTISDSGSGMDKPTREHIFDPFFTTKEVGKGTGLGLSVVYGIIKEHDGFINVYSEPGQGTTFKIYLPLIAGLPEEIKAEVEKCGQGGSETILFAEDDEPVRAVTKAVLEEFGYTVIVAINGQDAVDKYKENRDRIQLLLFDLIMPKKTGKEAYDEIKALDPGVKVLFASGYAPDVVRQRVLLEDRMPLIFKPVLPMELLAKVREALDL